MVRGAHIVGACLVALAAGCAGGDAGQATGTQDGAKAAFETFEVRERGQRLVVRVYRRAEGGRTITVSSRSYRGLDRSDGKLAYDAAFEAAGRIDCAGQPLKIYADTGFFQESGRRSAFTTGESAWLFQGRCGA